jgi:hypothetical protein
MAVAGMAAPGTQDSVTVETTTTAIYLTTFKVKKSKYSLPSEVDMARREEWKSRL